VLRKAQRLFSKALLGNHDTKVRAEILGLLRKRFDGVWAFPSFVVLAFDDPKNRPSPELPTNYDIILARIPRAVL
jgi:hypothetical protein